LHIDLTKLFVPDISLLEIIIRGSVMYLSLFLLLRVILKRQSGTVGITDLLLVVLLADAAQNGMAGSYESITGGIVLVSTIIFWSYALDWLGYRFPGFQRLVHPPPLLLVQDGRILRKNMREELITEEELMGMLRQQGVEAIEEVKSAYMEGTGQISVVTYDKKNESNGSQKRQGI
jgi:uncharacterized membrane protein YcaP (DUF421 family)